MGFSSWDCLCCGHSLRHAGATTDVSHWMCQVVMIDSDGNRIQGKYSGYASIETRSGGEHEFDYGGDFAVYHRACYVACGNPQFTKKSPPSRDQGHFVGEYDPAEPKNPAECEALLVAANKAREQDAQARKASREKLRQEYIDQGKSVPEWLNQ